MLYNEKKPSGDDEGASQRQRPAKGRMNMKVLLVIDQFDNANNGTTISARRFAETLGRHGNEVRVVSTGEAADGKYVVKELPLLPLANWIVKKQGMCFAQSDRRLLEEAVGWADVVHFLLPFWLGMAGVKVAERLKVPHTAAFHVQPENITYTLGMGRWAGLNDGLYKGFNRLFYNRFTHIHCPSNFIAGELRRNGYTAQLHVISNGVDPAFTYRRLPKPPEYRDRFLILMVGRLSNEKRQDVLIEAVKKSRYANHIQLILAGKGPNRRKYEEMGRGLRYPPVMGFYTKDQLRDLIATCNLYVHAADAEIEAISCMEAFCSGLVPVISNSPKSATPQFALDDRSLFRSGDSDDLAAKIDYWASHGDERRAMGRRYSEYGKRYGIDVCVEQIEEMFRQAIEEQSAAGI